MKIGVTAEDHDDGFSSSHEFPPREVVLYDVDLPTEVRKGLEIVSDHIPPITRIPLANQTAQGHGNDYGLVFRKGEFKSIAFLPGECSTDFTKHLVVARISMGMPKTIETIAGEKVVFRNPSNLGRLHLNVYGARNFLPIGEDSRLESDMTSFGYASEKIHLSLRWVDGQFDNSWNDTSQWLANKDSQVLGRPEFKEMRTTYFEQTNSRDHVNGNFCYDTSGWVPYDVQGKLKRGDRILNMADIEAMIGERKARLLPAEIPLEEFMKLFPDGTSEADARKSAGYHFSQTTRFPQIGYAPTLNILSKFGDVSPTDADRIPRMGMNEGVEYIFGKVLPAVKNFVRA